MRGWGRACSHPAPTVAPQPCSRRPFLLPSALSPWASAPLGAADPPPQPRGSRHGHPSPRGPGLKTPGLCLRPALWTFAREGVESEFLTGLPNVVMVMQIKAPGGGGLPVPSPHRRPHFPCLQCGHLKDSQVSLRGMAQGAVDGCLQPPQLAGDAFVQEVPPACEHGSPERGWGPAGPLGPAHRLNPCSWPPLSPGLGRGAGWCRCPDVCVWGGTRGLPPKMPARLRPGLSCSESPDLCGQALCARVPRRGVRPPSRETSDFHRRAALWPWDTHQNAHNSCPWKPR